MTLKRLIKMIDINNGIIKTVRTLWAKKGRDAEGLFIAEGTKCVRDTWNAFECQWLIATRSWYEQLGTAEHYDKVVITPKGQMSRMSQFDTPSEVIAVYKIPQRTFTDEEVLGGLSIVLDNIQDPGNLGTIMRLADWYGIGNIFASPGTVDVYNHKVVQATMGAIARVKVHYTDLESLLERYNDLPVLGTFLDGENIYRQTLEPRGFVVFGNEGRGIGGKVSDRATRRLFIPCAKNSGSESLNVGVAAAITISEIMRHSFQNQ